MTSWQYFPKSDGIPEHLKAVIEVFRRYESDIESSHKNLHSNQVLAILRKGLVENGFSVESGKTAEGKIKVPVLFGRNGELEKYFEADAFHEATGTVLEVAAGRGVDNNEFLKDLFEACAMHNANYLCIAIRNVYRGNRNFEKVLAFFDTLYASRRLSLPLKGVLIIGY